MAESTMIPRKSVFKTFDEIIEYQKALSRASKNMYEENIEEKTNHPSAEDLELELKILKRQIISMYEMVKITLKMLQSFGLSDVERSYRALLARNALD